MSSRSPADEPRLRPQETTAATRLAEAIFAGQVERFGNLPTAQFFVEVLATRLPARTVDDARETVLGLFDHEAEFLGGFATRLEPHVGWAFGAGSDARAAVRLLSFRLDRMLLGAIGAAIRLRFPFVVVFYTGLRLFGRDGSELLDATDRALAERILAAGGDEEAWPYRSRRTMAARLYDLSRGLGSPDGPTAAWIADLPNGEVREVPRHVVGDFAHVEVGDDGETIAPKNLRPAGES